jgi:tRNA pseudouridine55 synthase
VASCSTTPADESDEPMKVTDGLLVLDKPNGLTSRAALDRAQRWFPSGTRIGHTGTLDPLATGVLVICLGSATRLAEYVQQMSKTYRTTVRLGATSDTDDADGTVTPLAGAAAPDAQAVTACVAGFVGVQEQVPPAFSAAKVTGQRAYDLARAGREVHLTARTITIYAIDIVRYAYPDLELEVRCGKGTYIRSLARDLGERLGCGGYVHTLRRTRVGPFRVEDAVTLETDGATAQTKVRPAKEAVAELPAMTLPDTELRRLSRGQELPWPGVPTSEGDDPMMAIFAEDGALAMVARLDRARRRLKPEKVLRG